jgi:IS30 family transposase
MRLVNAMLQEGWAPEQIAGRLRRVDHPRGRSKWISLQTIYRHIWADKATGGGLFRYLRRGGKRYLKRCGRTRGQIVGRVSIDERPAIVDERRRMGDWEGDTIVGRQHKGLVATFVERKTGYLVARKMNDKRASSLNDAAKAALQSIPHPLIRTFTFDNGKEFAGFNELEKHFDADVYFAHPYSAWERGTNENTNGLLRQFLPKKTDFRLLTQAQLDIITQRLNNRPRKRLDYRTPCEVFKKAIVALRV